MVGVFRGGGGEPKQSFTLTSRNALANSIIPDGPGQLRDFQGEPAAGLWLFTMIDNSPFHTGRVESLVGYIEPDDKTNLNGVLLTAEAMAWSECLPIDVPLNAT